MCIVWCMRTNVEIDDDLMRDAIELSGARTKREVVDLALRELVGRYRRLEVLGLRGRVQWSGDLQQSRRGRV
jgi:Arc/MetJ family transcription regulator